MLHQKQNSFPESEVQELSAQKLLSWLVSHWNHHRIQVVAYHFAATLQSSLPKLCSESGKAHSFLKVTLAKIWQCGDSFRKQHCCKFWELFEIFDAQLEGEFETIPPKPKYLIIFKHYFLFNIMNSFLENFGNKDRGSFQTKCIYKWSHNSSQNIPKCIHSHETWTVTSLVKFHFLHTLKITYHHFWFISAGMNH